eukprot:6205580-Pleurochrysis_carterae.AAC.1
MGYWREIKQSKSAEEHEIIEGEKRGRLPSPCYINQFLFMMVQLRSVPYNRDCSALFEIEDSVGSSYLTTWVLLAEDVLLKACKVGNDQENLLRDEPPEKFAQLFGGQPVILTLDCLHRKMGVTKQ